MRPAPGLCPTPAGPGELTGAGGAGRPIGRGELGTARRRRCNPPGQFAGDLAICGSIRPAPRLTIRDN
jgi:hypothetical protein